MGNRISSWFKHINNLLNATEILSDSAISFLNASQLIAQLFLFCIDLSFLKLLNDIPNFMSMNTFHHSRENRMGQCSEEPSEEKRVLLMPSYIRWIFGVCCTIFHGEIAWRNVRVHKVTMQFVDLDDTFNLLFPWEKVRIIQFDGDLLHEGFECVLQWRSIIVLRRTRILWWWGVLLIPIEEEFITELKTEENYKILLLWLTESELIVIHRR